MREGLAIAAAGVGSGVCVALACGRILSSLLFGVNSRDPWTYTGVMALLLLVALIATAIPARRASALDPLMALRD